MTDRPILFSTPMVKALLNGSKTQTRRVLKPAKHSFDNNVRVPDGSNKGDVKLPLINVGDRLWVRESWSGVYALRNTPPKDRKACDTPDCSGLHDLVWYWADGSPDWGDWERPRPSIHMPRWASRITLIVTEVRVERLQNISANDAVAEGCYFKRWITGEYPFFDQGVEADNRQLVRMYRDLWNSINGPDAWDENPWVFAVTFDVRKGNIDA